MLRFLSDENLNGNIVRGRFHRKPALDLVRVQDVGLEGMADPAILEWASKENRILLTHDRDTIPAFASERIEEGTAMAGVFVLHDRRAVSEAIEEVLTLDECSEQAEWHSLIVFLPL